MEDAMNDETFERLRRDAARLRYEPSERLLSRLASRIRERIAQPTIVEIIAAWFRPVSAAVAALALVASLTMIAFNGTEQIDLAAEPFEISMAEGVLSVGD
jgi:hypothetical protein